MANNQVSLSSEIQKSDQSAINLKAEYVELRTSASQVKMYVSLQIARDISEIPDDAFGILFVYDVTADESFSQLEQMSKGLDVKMQKSPMYSPVRILVGTHKDPGCPHRIPYGKIQQLKTKYGMLWVEVGKEQNVRLLFR